jgi:hypothetical protein
MDKATIIPQSDVITINNTDGDVVAVIAYGGATPALPRGWYHEDRCQPTYDIRVGGFSTPMEAMAAYYESL